MRPSSTSSRISSRVIASAMSPWASGSSQTRFSPTSKTSAASRFCAERSVICFHLDFLVGRVQDADALLLGFLFDPFALACANGRRDPNRLAGAVDAFEIVEVLDVDFLEAAWVFAPDGFRRSVAGLDFRTLALDTAALLGQRPAGSTPGFRRPLFLVVVLSVELRFALAFSSGEESLLILGEVGRLLGQPAGLQFSLDVFFRLGFFLDAFVFDLGLGLLGDLEVTDVGFDSGGECVTDTVGLGQVVLVGLFDVLDGLEAGVAQGVCLARADAADVLKFLWF